MDQRRRRNGDDCKSEKWSQTWSLGHAFGPSHCCPEKSLTEEAMPEMPKSPLQRRANKMLLTSCWSGMRSRPPISEAKAEAQRPKKFVTDPRAHRVCDAIFQSLHCDSSGDQSTAVIASRSSRASCNRIHKRNETAGGQEDEWPQFIWLTDLGICNAIILEFLAKLCCKEGDQVGLDKDQHVERHRNDLCHIKMPHGSRRDEMSDQVGTRLILLLLMSCSNSCTRADRHIATGVITAALSRWKERDQPQDEDTAATACYSSRTRRETEGERRGERAENRANSVRSGREALDNLAPQCCAMMRWVKHPP